MKLKAKHLLMGAAIGAVVAYKMTPNADSKVREFYYNTMDNIENSLEKMY